MIAEDESALICDLAETYRIYDYRSLPVNLVATFSCGLRDNSRIKQKLRGIKTSDTNLLLSIIADRLGMLATGGKLDEYLVDSYIEHDEEEKPKDFQVFDSFDDFTKRREEILEKLRKEGNNG